MDPNMLGAGNTNVTVYVTITTHVATSHQAVPMLVRL